MKNETPGITPGVGLFYNYRAFSFVDGYALSIDHTTGSVGAGIRNSGVNDGVSTPSLVNSGEWTHITGVFSDSALNIYIDGALSASKSISGVNYEPSSLPELTIGSQSHVPGHPNHSYVGLMDDVYFFNHALSADEINSLAGTVPEPSTYALIALGLGALRIGSRYRSKK